MAARVQFTPEKSWVERGVWVVNTAGRVRPCWQHIADLHVDSWTQKSVTVSMVLCYAAMVSQVSGSMLACFRNVYIWPLKHCSGPPYNLMLLVKSPNRMIHGMHSGPMTHPVASMLGRDVSERTTLVMQPSQLMWRILQSFCSHIDVMYSIQFIQECLNYQLYTILLSDHLLKMDSNKWTLQVLKRAVFSVLEN